MNKRKSKGDRSGMNETVLAVPGALSHLENWEKIRFLRDMWGGRVESEITLSNLTGKLTDNELLMSLLNDLEKDAESRVAAWRRALCIPENEKKGGSKDPGIELLAIYETWLAVRRTQDPGLIQYWFASQPFAVQFLIISLGRMFLKPNKA